MHKPKSQTNLPSKNKESTRLSQGIASNFVSTELYYTVTINDKPTKSEFYQMGKLQKRCYWKNGEEI